MSSSRRARLNLRRRPRTPSPLSSRSSSSSRSRSPCSSRSNSPYWRPPSPPGPPPKTPPSLSSSCPSSPTYSPLSTPSSPPRSSDLPKPPSPSLLSHPSPQMCPPTFSDPPMFSYPPPLHSNLIRPPTDFTQTTLQCPVWPTMPNPCALQYSTSSATPLTSKFAVTNSTTHYSSGFNASSNRITSRPMPENFCWRPIYRDSYQQTQCHYDYTSANNYPKPVPENSNANCFAVSPRNYKASPQNRPQFYQNPRFIPRKHQKPKYPIKNQSNGNNQEKTDVTGTKKRKRKSLSQQPEESQKRWNREDAEKAIAIEMKFEKNYIPQILIRFPDPEISQQTVRALHSDIKNVYFQIPCTPRWCLVKLQPDANIESVVKKLNETLFHGGKLHAEIKKSHIEEKKLEPEYVDPYTLYIGNLPRNIIVTTVKNEFPKAVRVDVGFAQKVKESRYAFIKFSNTEDAIESYIEKHNLEIEGRTVFIRFRRTNEFKNEQNNKNLIEKNKPDIENLGKIMKIEKPNEENIDMYSPPSNIKISDDEYYEENIKPPHSEINCSVAVPLSIKKELNDVPDSFTHNKQIKTEINSEVPLPKISTKKELDDVPDSFIYNKQIKTEKNSEVVPLPKIDKVCTFAYHKKNQKWMNYSSVKSQFGDYVEHSLQKTTENENSTKE